MYELIKEWEQDGFQLRAYTEPDESGITPEDVEESPMPEDTQEWVDRWYRRLEEFNNGGWHYVGVIVEARMQDVLLADSSLWGIESDDAEYHKEVADELADQTIAEAREKLTQLLLSYDNAR
jgi:hypothetical protein